MLLTNMVKDERWEAAVSSEAASDPATLEAAGALDAYSCIGDHTASQSDVTSACTQRFLRGTPTWTSIPRERWPADWRGKFFNPVVPQVLNIYGDPESRCDLGRAFRRHHVRQWIPPDRQPSGMLLASQASRYDGRTTPNVD